ncbi:tetratricopeptide repeat protein [bacterium]|nr:tetratricopeptide repeat protein [bacterium]NBX98353.1 tetratricopeptide repeat protein [bacterium]NDC93743.1 tetratricopeptide repeat protein [bacterium]NDD82884.1 tetratricopeptide repeat protein [bacterium]NDG28679.1 tetratricopeptide repeat protein [bacterium]
MLSLIIVCICALLAITSSKFRDTELSPIPLKISDQLSKLWDIAHQGMRENRLLRAEKALLTILKMDEKNAAAYNRLGILYAKQKEYKDAIDCFEIASSIEPTASSLHNLGLIYLETENYNKAAVAFEQALKLEDTLAARHIAYAKVQEKLGNDKIVIAELEKAAEIEPNKESFMLLHKAYESRGMQEDAALIAKRIETLIMPAGQPKRIMRPKRVVV